MAVSQASAQSGAERATSAGACAQSKATVESIRSMSISQLDTLFKTLPANPPFPNGAAQGYAWLDSTSKTPIEIQNFVHPIWQGKTFYNVLGSHIVLDLFFGQQVPPGTMHYGTSHLDGRGVLVLDWTAISPFYDEVRMVAPGVYIGNSYFNQSPFGKTMPALIPTVFSALGISTNQHFTPNTPFLNFILNENCPTTYWSS
jgi:hypothetical protein